MSIQIIHFVKIVRAWTAVSALLAKTLKKIAFLVWIVEKFNITSQMAVINVRCPVLVVFSLTLPRQCPPVWLPARPHNTEIPPPVTVNKIAPSVTISKKKIIANAPHAMQTAKPAPQFLPTV